MAYTPEEQKAIDIDKAVRKARAAEKNKRALFGCFGLIVASLLIGKCMADLGQEDKSAALAGIHGDFTAQPVKKGDTPGTVMIEGWSTTRGADEQVVFTFSLSPKKLMQCQYWSNTLSNHLTGQNPAKEECSFGKGADLPGDKVGMAFTMHPQSMSEGKPRAVTGTLILSQKVMREFARAVGE